jgi:hypothetical protein
MLGDPRSVQRANGERRRALHTALDRVDAAERFLKLIEVAQIEAGVLLVEFGDVVDHNSIADALEGLNQAEDAAKDLRGRASNDADDNSLPARMGGAGR